MSVIEAKSGSFAANTSTGNQAITGVGFQPKAVIFFLTGLTAVGDSADCRGGIGCATSSTERWATAWASDDASGAANAGQRFQTTKCIVVLTGGNPTVDGEADFVSMDADGFTINWTDAPASAVLVEYLALGGTGLSAKAGNSAVRTSLGTQAVTGVGFVPKALLLASVGLTAAGSSSSYALSVGMAAGATKRGTVSLFDLDASADASLLSYARNDRMLASQSSGSLDWEVDLTSFDADGFTYEVTDAGNADIMLWLALGGADLLATVVEDFQPTSAGSAPESGLGITPRALVGFSSQVHTTPDTSWVLGNVAVRNAQLAFGVSDGSSEASMWTSGLDAAAVMDTDRAQSGSKFLQFRNTSRTVLAEADSALTADGYTLDWTTADAVARELFVLVLGNFDRTASASARATVTASGQKEASGSASASAAARATATGFGPAETHSGSASVSGSTRVTASGAVSTPSPSTARSSMML